ncbi:MAG: bifunctional DNA primase/polymerase [Egibacteraceae bacterium]
MNRIPLAEAAARYAAASWAIFPLHEIRDGACSCSAGPTCAHPGRHPRTRNGHHDATTDRDTVTRWWHRWSTANLATPNGSPSGLAVIDLDGPEGAATWTALENKHGHLATAAAQTPHGRHLWYRIPERLLVPRRIRGLGPGIDLLGNGGYTLLPPSHVPCLKPDHRAEQRSCHQHYTWTDQRNLAELPSWIPQQLPQREHAPTTAPHEIGPNQRRNYGQTALDGEVARVTNAPKGGQNDTLNYAAWRLGQLAAAGELDLDQARTALLQAAHDCGHIANDGLAHATRTIESGLTAGLQQPRTRPHRLHELRGRML